MKFSVELAEVYEDGALIMVEGDDWIVAIPFTLGDNKATIDIDALLTEDESMSLSDVKEKYLPNRDIEDLRKKPDISMLRNNKGK